MKKKPRRKTKPRRPEPKAMVSLRVAPELLKAVHEYVLDYNRAGFTPGFGFGEPDAITESVALRRALAKGLTVLRQELETFRKGGAR